MKVTLRHKGVPTVAEALQQNKEAELFGSIEEIRELENAILELAEILGGEE